jgi:hypothetical protein
MYTAPEILGPYVEAVQPEGGGKQLRSLDSPHLEDETRALQ